MIKIRSFHPKSMKSKHIHKTRILLASSLVSVLLVIACFSTLVQANQQSTENTANGLQHDIVFTDSDTPLSPQQQFRCDVAYAYIGQGNSSDVTKNEAGIQMNPYSQYPSAIYLNVTHISNNTAEACDVKFEVYLIKMVSDKGITEKYIWFDGTNYNSSFSDFKQAQLAATQLGKLIDRRTLTTQGGHFKFNWTTGISVFEGVVGTMGHYNSRPSSTGLWSNGEPKEVSIDISILGWILLKGDSVSVDTNNQKATLQINLQSFKGGFIYNKIVPNDQLSQMNLFCPVVNETKK